MEIDVKQAKHIIQKQSAIKTLAVGSVSPSRSFSMKQGGYRIAT